MDVLVGCDFSKQFEFYSPFVITKGTYMSTKANIFVAYTVQRTGANQVLDDDITILDDDDSEEDTRVEIQTFFFISTSNENNPKKNPGIVHDALQKVFDHLNFGRPGGPRSVFLVSDGEYRNRHHFAWLGKQAVERKGDLWWSFYVAGHGKGLYDSEGGVLKTWARAYVKQHSTPEFNPINDIHDLIKHARDNLANPKGRAGKPPTVVKRHFFHQEGIIEQAKNGVQVAGSNMLYAYRARGSRDSLVEAREFSCFCDICLTFGMNCTRPGGPWKKTGAGYIRDDSDDGDETGDDE